MPMIIAKCGNRCDLCPLYVENYSAIGWEKINNSLYKYHQQNTGAPPHHTQPCDGCLSVGYVARKDCRIRKCANSRSLDTCAECEELFCSLLKEDMKIIECAVERFRGDVPEEDFNRYLKPFLIREVLLTIRSEKRSANRASNEGHSFQRDH